MGSARLLGIDIGTTGVRAAIFDEVGALLADASVPCLFEAPEPGWAEVPAERWWRATQSVLATLAEKSTLSLADVTGIGVVGQAPTVVLVDDAGAALGSAVLWLDTRAATEARELDVHAYYLGPKLLWLARHGAPAQTPDSARGRADVAWGIPDPDVLSRARWLLQSHAFVAYRLTGEAAIDPSTAALALPFFDLATRTWTPSACAPVGVRPEQLPPIRAAHEVIGHVTAGAAEAIGHGLRAGTPVVAGGGDFAAATLGAGVIEEGEACLMLGTAGNLLVPRKTPGTDRRLINAHHVGADRWLSLGGTLSGGAQEWLRYALTRAVATEDTAVRSALPAFEVLDAEAEELSPGSEGLLFLPYLQGERTPIWDTEARGAYVGLGLHHARGHLWRALLEGIALGFVDCQEVLEHDGVRLRDVVAANGGGKSALFRQILCDALGVPLTYTPASGGTVAGAAILAGLGTGAIHAPSDARTWRGSAVRHEPNPKAHERYRALLALRRQAYEGLKPVFAGLAGHR
ncbi:MAG TPA: FGGY family carbohydrate kinase [Labilithrix sp.]|nr:FGGY family carbohydrate kinase [Labilithrix sp.]